MAIKRCRDITSLNLNYLNNISFCSATHNLVGPYLSLVRGVFPDDLYSDRGLLPKDPVDRAHVHFFIDAFYTKLLPQHNALFFRSEPDVPDALLKAVAEIQDLRGTVRSG